LLRGTLPLRLLCRPGLLRTRGVLRLLRRAGLTRFRGSLRLLGWFSLLRGALGLLRRAGLLRGPLWLLRRSGLLLLLRLLLLLVLSLGERRSNGAGKQEQNGCCQNFNDFHECCLDCNALDVRQLEVRARKINDA
jgi:hypothetical protein